MTTALVATAGLAVVALIVYAARAFSQRKGT